ncbi:MAG: endonuclease domain-containing protein [Planctomycetaceae bacterium]
MTLSFNRSEQEGVRKKLRSNMPPAEVILWSKLKARQLLGCKFRRQFGIGPFVLDFYSPELKLGVELDGDSHYFPGAKVRDAKRDMTIAGFGIRILRIINTEVYENLEGVIEYLAKEVRLRIDEFGPTVVRGRRSQGKRRPPRAPPC